MRHQTVATVVVLTALLVAVTFACSTGDQAATSPPAAVLGPEEVRQARLEAAMAGLEYSEHAVLPAPGHAPLVSDPAEARRLAADGEALLARNRTVEAIQTFVAAVLAAPDLPGPYLGLGRALRVKGRAPEALGSLRTARRLGADPAETGLWIGALQHGLGRSDDALDTWRSVVALAPGHGSTHARLAALLAVRGDRREARRHLEAARAAGAAVPAQLVATLEGGGVPTASSMDDPGALAVGPQVRVNVTGTPSRYNETTAAALPGPPAEVVAGWNDYRVPQAIRAGFGVSLDGGATWTDQLLRPDPFYQCEVEGDPMTAVDVRTGTLWAGAIAFALEAGEVGGLYVARKDPGATTFGPPVIAASGFRDKGWMAAGPLPGQPDTTRLHLAHADGYQYSDDLGDSFSPVDFLDSGVGFLPRVGPGGELYIAYWDYFDGVMLARSLDGGTTFGPAIRAATRLDTEFFDDPVQLPGTYRAFALAALAVDPTDGALYVVWFDTTSIVGSEYDVDLYLATSADQGTTFSAPLLIDLGPGDQFFPWIEVDDAGRLHLLYYDTGATAQSDADADGLLDASYAVSDDGGQTWVRAPLTPTPFGSAITDLGNGQFIGDYQGIAVAGERAIPVYMGEDAGRPAIYSHVVESAATLLADGFESGDTSAWSASVP